MREFSLFHDCGGWGIEDQFGVEWEPGWRVPDKQIATSQLIRVRITYMENYEPPDPPGWEAGFADNH